MANKAHDRAPEEGGEIHKGATAGKPSEVSPDRWVNGTRGGGSR